MPTSSRATPRIAVVGAMVLPFVALLASTLPRSAAGQAPESKAGESTKEKGAAPKEELIPLNKNVTVLLDKAGNRVILRAEVALREGTLEQLCCLKMTKEHESILSLDAKAQAVHAALLALGAKQGTPVRFTEEKTHPPTGQRIDIFLNWTDGQGKSQRAPAQSWIRHATRRFWSVGMEMLPPGVKLPKDSELRYDAKLKELSWYGAMTVKQRDEFLALTDNNVFRKAIGFFYDKGVSREMKADWVFAGSGFYRDEDTKKERYLAEDGDLICVANFSTATLDLSVESSAQGEGLLFEAWTEKIPPKGTAVTIELIPSAEKPQAAPAPSRGQ